MCADWRCTRRWCKPALLHHFSGYPAELSTLTKSKLIFHTHAAEREPLRDLLLSQPEQRASRRMEAKWFAGGWTSRSSWLRLPVTSLQLHPFSFSPAGFPPVLLSSPLFHVGGGSRLNPPSPPSSSSLSLSAPLRANRHSSVRQMRYELKRFRL